MQTPLQTGKTSKHTQNATSRIKTCTFSLNQGTMILKGENLLKYINTFLLNYNNIK